MAEELTNVSFPTKHHKRLKRLALEQDRNGLLILGDAFVLYELLVQAAGTASLEHLEAYITGLRGKKPIAFPAPEPAPLTELELDARRVEEKYAKGKISEERYDDIRRTMAIMAGEKVPERGRKKATKKSHTS